MRNSFNQSYYEYLENNYQLSYNAPYRTIPSQYHSISRAIYESDEFRMYGFKIKRCPRLRSHDWTQCPFAHRSERAARRDPRKYNYCAFPCPDFRDTGVCWRGHNCHFAHGVFEQWLHPERYRTRLCTAGVDCQRQVCFFAHTVEQLRLEEPRLNCHCLHELHSDAVTDNIHGNKGLFTLPDVREKEEIQYILPNSVREKRILNNRAVATSAETSDFPITAFTGGNDFLASLSGVRVKEGKEKATDILVLYASDQDVPNINWVEEMVLV